MIRLVLARTAFAQTRALAESLAAASIDPESLTFSPQIAGVVVTYARSFTGGEGLGVLEEKFIKFDDVELQNMHSKLIDIRNKIYAHRDVDGVSAFTLDPSATAVPYQLLVNINAAGELAFSPSAPELNPQLLPAVIRLCRVQENRAIAAVLDLLPHLQKGKIYPPGRYTLGVDFP